MNFKLRQKYKFIKTILIWSAALIVLLQVAFFIFEKIDSKRSEKEAAKQTEVVIPEPIMLFNIQIDSFNVVRGEVKSGHNLSDILTTQAISMATVDEISKKSILVFDLRKMKVNNPYYFFMNKKQPTKVEYFIYEITPVDYVVYQMGDSLRIYKEKKPMITQVKTAGGEITSSLWNAMTDQALSPNLAMDLSNIFQWSVDFFGIQKGDKFKVVYEENFVSGKSIGIGRIFAAQFVHAKEDFYAFRFTQNNEDSYFDDKGKSLKTAFLKAPLKFSRVSSVFSNSRFHPVLKIRRPHHGVDYAAQTGTPVMSIGDGTVIAKAYQRAGGGNYIKIKHNATYTTSYMHLSKFGDGIANGMRVHQGQVIGYVGSTGLASGPHLDFRVFLNGTPIDPLKMKSPPTEPIAAGLMKDYSLHRDSMMVKLQKERF